MRMLFLVIAASLAATPAAMAQDDNRPRLKDVFVRSADGVELRGQVLDLQPLTLSMYVDGVRRDIPIDTIDRIQTRGGDSVWNGALIGAALAAAAVLWGQAMAPESGEWGGMFVAATAAYGLIGAGIDAMIPGRTTIYSKPRQTPSLAAQNRSGLAVKIRF